MAGTHLNAEQFRQLCNRPRTVYLSFDVDANQSDQHAALQGSEWFLMWQSKIWNGLEEALRVFTFVSVVFLVVVQREPTPDQSATLLLAGTSRFPVIQKFPESNSHKPVASTVP